MDPARPRLRSGSMGAAYALAAYGIWGVAPIYWKALGALPAPEILGHRVVWSCALALLLVLGTGGWRELHSILRAPRRALPIALSAALIGCNWLTFIWAVLHGQIVATSLGYYVTPLVNVALGIAVLGERLRPWQIVAVALAALGVARMGVAVGGLPWVALVLAFSFAFYGLVRKLAPVAPVVGFGLETLLLAPVAVAYLAWSGASGRAAFPAAQPALQLLVVAAGAFTAAPLLCFNSAAKRLRLATLGFFQYLAPSITLLLAVALYDEPFTRDHAASFGCVWAALALYSFDALRAAGAGRPGARAAAV
jgi:chloramphenicol-sensitive protein RarD